MDYNSNHQYLNLQEFLLHILLKENRDIDQESLLKIVKSNKLSEKYIKNKSIVKIIFVKNRLINLLVDD